MSDDLLDDEDLASADAVSDSTGGDPSVPAELLDELASNLLWRIARVSDDSPVTVRVGLASSASLFQELPRLRSASDAELEGAIKEGSLRVEWVGPRPRTER